MIIGLFVSSHSSEVKVVIMSLEQVVGIVKSMATKFDSLKADVDLLKQDSGQKKSHSRSVSAHLRADCGANQSEGAGQEEAAITLGGAGLTQEILLPDPEQVKGF